MTALESTPHRVPGNDPQLHPGSRSQSCHLFSGSCCSDTEDGEGRIGDAVMSTLAEWKMRTINRPFKKRQSLDKTVQLRMDVEAANKRWMARLKTVPLKMTKTKSSEIQTNVDDDEEDFDGTDAPDRNFTSSLVLTHLQDGVFRAEMVTSCIPSGRIAIRTKGYRLEIVLERRASNINLNGNTASIVKPVYCGSVWLPIFVDMSTLDFTLDEDQELLVIVALTKGYQSVKASVPEIKMKRSLSMDMLATLGRGRLSSSNRSSLKDSGTLKKHTLAFSTGDLDKITLASQSAGCAKKAKSSKLKGIRAFFCKVAPWL